VNRTLTNFVNNVSKGILFIDVNCVCKAIAGFRSMIAGMLGLETLKMKKRPVLSDLFFITNTHFDGFIRVYRIHWSGVADPILDFFDNL